MHVNKLIAKANSNLQDMGNGEEFSLAQLDAITNAFEALNAAPNVSVPKPNTDKLVAACRAIEEAWADGEKGDWRGALDNALRLAKHALAEQESMPPVLSPTITFKMDNKEINIGQDVRIEYEDREEGRSLIVILTHEGIIMDLLSNGETVATSSLTYNEQVEEMLDAAK